MNGYDSVLGYNQNETFYGGAGDDRINGGAGNDVIYGESGNDIIEAGSGNDKLYGGAGNDTLRGGTGDDIYYFELGDGEDIILDDDSSLRNADRIVFGKGISPADVYAERVENDLIIKYSATDKITIKNAYAYKSYVGYGAYFIENIEFSDGTIWNIEEIGRQASIHRGTEANDVMHSYDDVLGYTRNETFYGGAGNDTIYGGDGNDTYIFGRDNMK